MGQQQLLLVILVTIIVGIATVVAINTFGASADAAVRDAVRIDLVGIGASAQGFYIRPKMIGGGGRSFEEISFNRIAFGGSIDPNENAMVASNENGTFVISGVAQDEFIVTVTANNSESTMIAARICPNGAKMGEAGTGTAPAPPACD